MKIQNTDVYGFHHALRAQRNPLENWHLSDSNLGEPGLFPWQIMGPKDLELLLKLTKRGGSHRKALRFINIYATLTLPRYVWTEFDTYKVSCTRLSCSTMHKLGHRDLTVEDFQDNDVSENTLNELNELGREYRRLKAEKAPKAYNLVRKMKRRLPEGFLQRADVVFNYEVAINMFMQRHDHRLEEWRFDYDKDKKTVDPKKIEDLSLCNWLYSLPFMPKILKAAGFAGFSEINP